MYKPNMKSTEDKMVYQGTSSVKKWLIRIYSFGAALNVIALIVAITSASGSAIGLTIIGLVINGVTLAAIVKQWRVVLVICQIILFIGIGLSVITTFIGALLLGALSSDFTEEQKSLMVTNIIFLSVAFVWNVFLFVLLRRYTNELASPSYA